MNLGSSKKWVELLQSGAYTLNDGYGLRWSDNSFSAVGVLEDFITKTWTTSTYHGYANVDGSVLLASKECLRRVKAKTNLEEVDDLTGYGINAVCHFIETEYELL